MTAPPTPSRHERVKVAYIQADGTTQKRVAGIDLGVVAEYADAMEAGSAPPRVHIDGEVWHLDVGAHHRVPRRRGAGRANSRAGYRPSP